MKNKKINIFEGRTNEWDSNEWQGRSQRQVENNYKVMKYAFIISLGFLIGYGITSLIIYMFGG
jgi:hypothetical protein